MPDHRRDVGSQRIPFLTLCTRGDAAAGAARLDRGHRLSHRLTTARSQSPPGG
jgi:hypothetical protein